MRLFSPPRRKFWGLGMAAVLAITGCSPSEGGAGSDSEEDGSPESVDLDISVEDRRAIWLDARTIALDEESSRDRDLELVVGGTQAYPLAPEGVLEAGQVAESQRYAGYQTFTVPESLDPQAALRESLAVVDREDETTEFATGVQAGPVLDDLYASAVETDLGLLWEDGIPTFAVWAPTAHQVELEIYETPESDPTAHEMDYDPATGIWTLQGDSGWDRLYYTYRVEVWHPDSQQTETYSVTDPYSVSLTADSTRSQIVNLDDDDLAPEGWEELVRPEPVDPAAVHIWEVHVRDFSVADNSMPEELRGTYRAFGENESSAVQHLIDLSDAGITHVHLLPTYDIATIPGVDAAESDCDLASFEHDSPEQQECIAEVREQDAYNWGYDPFHFNVPEGSYSTEPEGVERIIEYREMVMALNELDLRVVNDVVYNHTHASGTGEKSVFDRIVPGYYHRYDPEGEIERSTCCENTAPERVMFDKFVVESVELWAEAYQVDGFRFDLMGHHPKENILAVQEALENIAPGILIYGEGWEFGEVENDALFEQASQSNMGGTDIGTFNDRMRDAAHGGGPFDEDPRSQGFGTGLLSQPNAADIDGDEEEQLRELLHAGDLVKMGLVGNLADYSFIASDGQQTTGADLDYNGAPAGYAEQPGETVNYVDAHDNEILFDILAYKLNHEVSGEDRARMQIFNLSLATLSQGSGFYTAGTELMRSKSLDRDSYDSGDWFNAIRWNCGASDEFGPSTNGFGAGLPPAWTTEEKWPYAEETLNAVEAPSCEDIEFSKDRFLEQLRIANSTQAFSLGSAEEVQQRVSFPLSGENETPGVITMVIDMRGLDDAFEEVVVVFNGTDEVVEQSVEDLSGTSLELHPVLQESVDPVFAGAEFDESTGTVTAPARSATVFVSE